MFDSLLHISLTQLIESVGYLGIFIMVFCESGIPFGFIFPGDSLLFASGLLASQHYFNISYLVPLIIVAAILGDSAGYWIGKKIGPHIFTKEDSFWFNKKHIRETEAFYTKYGMSAVIFARFVPVVRVFVPIFAGVGRMPYGKFLSYNIIGGISWGAGVTLFGYILGNTVPNAQTYLLPLVVVILITSMIPLVLEILRRRSKG